MTPLNPLAAEFVPSAPAALAYQKSSSSSTAPSRSTGTPGAKSRRPSNVRTAFVLKDAAALDSFLTQGDISTVTSVTFERDFHVRDEHLTRLADRLGLQLRSLRLGNSETGDGVWVTDASVRHIAATCPNLEVLSLESCVGITDGALAAVLTSLTRLRELHCTGHDRSSGALTCKALQPLLQAGAGAAAPQLRKLYVTDQQAIRYDTVLRLIKRRKELQVLAGETDGESTSWGLVLQQMGRNYGDGLYGNMGGRMRC